MENTQSCISLFREEKSDILKELIHACIDEICGRPGPLYHKFANSTDWSRAEYEGVHKLFSSILRNPISLYMIEEKMPQEYHELPDQVQQNILTCLKIRREQLTNALLKEYCKRKLPTVVDYDWRLKLVMGSSKMASLRESLLQLDLIIQNKQTRLITTLELNKDELDTMINSLEKLV